MELRCLLVGETRRLGVVLIEQDGSDSPNCNIKAPANKSSNLYPSYLKGY